MHRLKTKVGAILKLCPGRQAGIATHVHFNASPDLEVAQVRYTRMLPIPQTRLSQDEGESSLFLGGLSERLVVGLGERADLTLLAVLFVITSNRQSKSNITRGPNYSLTSHLAKRRSIWPRRSEARRGPSFRERRTVRAAIAR